MSRLSISLAIAARGADAAEVAALVGLVDACSNYAGERALRR
jgi:hypothetical protein